MDTFDKKKGHYLKIKKNTEPGFRFANTKLVCVQELKIHNCLLSENGATIGNTQIPDVY